MHAAYLLTGSNMGDRPEQLRRAIAELEKHAGEVVRVSPVFETDAWGREELPSHLNQALLVHTPLTPLELLGVIHGIENRLGRVRQEKWGVRMIDIDIIYFDEEIIDLPALRIPHPLMQERNFVLQPLSAIAPHYRHPVLNKTNTELLDASPDLLSVRLF